MALPVSIQTERGRVTSGRSNRPALRVVAAADADVDADRTLMGQLASGDGDALRLLTERHIRTVSAIARRMLRDDAEAEDVTQEAFVRLWRQAATLEIGDAGVRPWLHRVVSNLCIDRLRTRTRVTTVDELPEVPDAPRQQSGIESREMQSRVDGALKDLPERQRLALVLFHFEGLSQIEVGERMGVSDEAVESLLSRARRNLRSTLKNEWKGLLEKTVQ